MKAMTRLKFVLLAAACLSVGGCPMPPDNTPSNDRRFSEFVVDLIRNTSDTAEPVPLTNVTLTNVNDESETQFNGLFE